jgi:DNA invertase Pin-like site-specific DNA recombinase
MIVGYARVSIDGQSLESQQSALRQAGATQVYSEKVSGVVSDRKALGKALAAPGEGDVLSSLAIVLPAQPGLAQRPQRSSESWCRFSVPGR